MSYAGIQKPENYTCIKMMLNNNLHQFSLVQKLNISDGPDAKDKLGKV